MSNAMLEAMASGLPIITTRCEGVDELISDNGVVVDHADPKTLAQAVANLGNDHDRYKKMSSSATSMAQNLTWSSVARKYLDLYRKISAL